MNRSGADVYAALRLLVRDQRVIVLAGPPVRLLLRGSHGPAGASDDASRLQMTAEGIVRG